jgi:hypothetical protein
MAQQLQQGAAGRFCCQRLMRQQQQMQGPQLRCVLLQSALGAQLQHLAAQQLVLLLLLRQVGKVQQQQMQHLRHVTAQKMYQQQQQPSPVGSSKKSWQEL